MMHRRKNLFPLPGIEPQLLDSSAHSFVTVPKELFRLLQTRNKPSKLI
jgi:hypothetical protein